jgi:hypothetical protein
MNACRRIFQTGGLVAFALVLLAPMQHSRAEDQEAPSQEGSAPHTGATWRVGNNGVDSPNCGSRRRPCRTITQGIENAAPGDLVLVGPGLYGDINGSCEFPQTAEDDEEFGFLTCADIPNTNANGARICLNKAITVASVEGAESTIIDACGSGFAVVIFGSNSRFGLPRRGFTLLNSTGGALAISTRSNVTVAGNIADPVSGMGFQLEFGDNHRLVGNLARNAFRGFTAVNVNPTRGLQIVDNVAISNNTGFDLNSEDELVVRRNVAIGNDVGFAINGSGHMLLENSAVGNRNYGIWIQRISDGPPVSVTRNNIFGNNNVSLDGHVNCGILNDTNAVVQATNNFWGAPTGPGADPADDACEAAGGQIIHTPFAEKQFPLGHKRSLSQSKALEDVEQSDRAQ